MSENPIPPQSPAPAPGTVKVTGIERTGTGLTAVGVIAAAIPLVYLAFASNIKLDTLDSIKSVLTGGLIVTIAAAVIGLVATGLNVPNLGKRLGPGLSTAFSGATLVTMALFLFVTVLPRINAVQNLNDKIVPFGKSLNANCKNPLNAIKTDYTKVQTDATPLAGAISAIPTGGPIPTTTQFGTFAAAMTTDAATLQTDATNFATYQANLNKLTSPDKK
ncbi:MAG: hypothetical protein H0X24_16785, partial [Ktedonobacterales bacterium]|nr:hypothetical protein [Ktedonobacterales bacterium]